MLPSALPRYLMLNTIPALDDSVNKKDKIIVGVWSSSLHAPLNTEQVIANQLPLVGFPIVDVNFINGLMLD